LGFHQGAAPRGAHGAEPRGGWAARVFGPRKPWENHGKSIGNHGKRWEKHRKRMGKWMTVNFEASSMGNDETWGNFMRLNQEHMMI